MRRRLVSVVAMLVVLALAMDTVGVAAAKRHRRTKLHDCGDPTRGRPPDGLDVSLSLDRATYRRGESVRLTLSVHNGSGSTFSHEVGYPDAVFEVATGDKVVWSSTWATAYPAIAFEETFAPDETKTTTITWEQNLCRTGKDGIYADPPFAPGPPPAGTYTAHGSWRGRWSAEPVTFAIVR